MKRVRLRGLNDFDEWRRVARGLLLDGTRPSDVVWEDPSAALDLFAEPEKRPADIAGRAVGIVPPRFLDLAAAALCHREATRFALCYRLLFRLQKDRELIAARSDPDVSRLYRLVTEVRQDSATLAALPHFEPGATRFAAWVEPKHYTLERTAPRLARRFADKGWALFTPHRSAAWDGAHLVFGAGTRRQNAPRGTASEAAWRGYFAAIFEPAHTTVDPALLAAAARNRPAA